MQPRDCLGPYEIVAFIGAGGMGEVWRARDTRLGREVALKVLPATAVTDDKAHARLVREAQLASQLNHPHICTIHDVGECDGQTYVAMELVLGQSLAARLGKGPLPVEQVVRIGQQVADALAHAHQHGVVHRDLKSGNVMLTPEGRAKVLDFGLARRLSAEALTEATTLSGGSLTGPGEVTGTLAYMAPEQLLGETADARSDIWALGVVLHELVTGRRPFAGQTSFELTSAILKEAPEPLPATAPSALAQVIERCMAKEPGERFQHAGEVRAALEAVGSGSVATLPTFKQRRPARRRWLIAAAALVPLIVVLLALDVGGVRRRIGGSAAAARIESLAVLPLQNLSGDPEQDYFADGMTEELITSLAKIGALRVISRTSVMQYRGSTKPLPEIARELNVDAVIEGAVQREGDQVRVTAQLIRAATDQHLWAESYVRDLRNVLALQSEIAEEVAIRVNAALTPAERARLERAPAVDPASYEAYLKGKFHLNKMTPDGYEKGLGYLNEAVAKDPSNPAPHAALAVAYAIIGHERDPDAFDRAREEGRKAEELGGEPPAEMYLAFSMTKLYSDWDYAGAAEDLQRAIELNPSLGEAHRDYSWYLFLVGRREEALARMERAQEVEPLTPLFYADRGWQLWWMGEPDRALQEERKALELDPDFNEGLHVLGCVVADQGRFEEAIAAHERLASVDPNWRWGLPRTLALAGRVDDARRVLNEMLTAEPKPTGGWAGWFLAEDYAALGDIDEAFQWLEAAYRARHSFMPWIEDNPAFDPLCSDPRFADLVRRLNVPRAPE